MALGPVIATYQDPNYRADQNAKLAAMIGGLAAAFKRRRDEKRQRNDAALAQFLQFASKDPELAAGGYGEAIKKRLASDNPEVAPLVDALANRGKLAQSMKEGYDAWLQEADRMWTAVQDSRDHAAAQPDTIPSWHGPIPNVAKGAVLQQIDQFQPDQIFFEAAKKLPPSKRAAAQAYAKAHEQPFPALPMGYQVDLSKLPANVQAEMAARGTTDPTQVADEVEQLLNLKARRGVTEEKTHLTNEDIREAEAKSKLAKEELGLKGEQALKMENLGFQHNVAEENLKHGHDLSEDASRYAHTMSEIAARDAASGHTASDQKTLAGKLQKWQNESVMEYDNRLRAAVVDAGGSKEHAKAKKEFLAGEGMRPRKLTTPQAKQVEADLSVLGISPDDAESAAMRIASRYNAITSRDSKKDPTAALNEATLEEAVNSYLNTSAPELANDPQAWDAIAAQLRQRFYSLRRGNVRRDDALKIVAQRGLDPVPGVREAPAKQRVTGGVAVAVPDAKPPDRATVERRVRQLYPRLSADQLRAVVDDVMRKAAGGS